MHMTEKQKMLSGALYDSSDHELTERRVNAHKLCKLYNDTFEDETETRMAILNELIPNQGANLFIQGPVYFDYGTFTTFGDNFYANFNFTVLDCAPVMIGNDVFIGPNVTIATPVHPLCYQERNMRKKKDGSLYDMEYAKPVTIGSNCWIASNVTIAGGVTIGEGCVIGAGSVVTKDIPAGSLAVGNPCRVLREITEDDRME